MAKEKSITELKDEKKQLQSRSRSIIEAAKGEKRQFTAEENEELGRNQTRMAEINLEIDEKETENRQAPARRMESTKPTQVGRRRTLRPTGEELLRNSAN